MHIKLSPAHTPSLPRCACTRTCRNSMSTATPCCVYCLVQAGALPATQQSTRRASWGTYIGYTVGSTPAKRLKLHMLRRVHATRLRPWRLLLWVVLPTKAAAQRFEAAVHEPRRHLGVGSRSRSAASHLPNRLAVLRAAVQHFGVRKRQIYCAQWLSAQTVSLLRNALTA